MMECKKNHTSISMYHIERCLPGGWTANMLHVNGVDDRVGMAVFITRHLTIHIHVVGESNICETNDFCYIRIALEDDLTIITTASILYL